MDDDQEKIADLLTEAKSIAVVGLSRDPSKESHRVAQYLQSQGYRIIPVNPLADRILGENCYASLRDLPEQLKEEVEIVDVFRRSEDVPPVVAEAVELRGKHGNPKVIWMQLGITNEQAADEAKRAGMTVIQDRCIMVEHRRTKKLILSRRKQS